MDVVTDIASVESPAVLEKRQPAAAVQSAAAPAAATRVLPGPRPTPPTAAEHQAYQEMLAAQFAALGCNPLAIMALRQQLANAPAAANLAGGASRAPASDWSEVVSR